MCRLAILVLCLSLLFFSCSTESKNQSANVLIMLADDLGYTDLHSFGGKARTPNLDQLVEGGLKFTHFYAPAPNCSPSRTGLLTGRMPSRVGMYTYRASNHTMHLPGSEITLAECLKKRNYQTAHFGKWHLSCLPQDSSLNQPQPGDQGFDYSFGTENNAIPSHLDPENFVRNGIRVGASRGYSCQLLADEVKSWFEKHYQKNKPFFMYVAFHEVHTKIASPPEMIQYYQNEGHNNAEYLANVENMDRAAGNILEQLEMRGLLENTMVIFASDNGPYKMGSAGNLRGLKGEVFDGGIRVPGIFYFPKLIKSQQICETPAGLIDVFPTLAEVCGFELPVNKKIDGTSLMPLFHGELLKRETPLTWFFYRAFPEMALRKDNFVLIGNALDSVPRNHSLADWDMDFIKNIQLKNFELYNIAEDPSQINNLASIHPEILDEMQKQMLQILNEIKQEGPQWNGLFDHEKLPSKFKKEYNRN